MKVSYKKLWKLLIDRDMTQADLRKVSGLSSGSMTKMRQSEPVSMEVLWKVCTAIGCNIEMLLSSISTTTIRRHRHE